MWTCGFLNGLCYNDGLHNGLCCNDGLLWIMTCDDVLNNGLVFVDVYMYICGGQIRIWIVYIYMVRFEFELFIFLLKNPM